MKSKINFITGLVLIGVLGAINARAEESTSDQACGDYYPPTIASNTTEHPFSGKIASISKAASSTLQDSINRWIINPRLTINFDEVTIAGKAYQCTSLNVWIFSSGYPNTFTSNFLLKEDAATALEDVRKLFYQAQALNQRVSGTVHNSRIVISTNHAITGSK